VLVLVVELFEHLSNSVGREHWISHTSVYDVNNLHWIWANISHSVTELFISLIEGFQLCIVQEALPIV
jgi:hypothetical protein